MVHKTPSPLWGPAITLFRLRFTLEYSAQTLQGQIPSPACQLLQFAAARRIPATTMESPTPTQQSSSVGASWGAFLKVRSIAVFAAPHRQERLLAPGSCPKLLPKANRVANLHWQF